MINFKELEKEFLYISSEESSRLTDFYSRYADYFKQLDFADQEQTKKEIWMLAEISCAFKEQSDNATLSKLEDYSLSLFKDYSKKFSVSLDSDVLYKSILLQKGLRKFKQKRHFIAIKYFNLLKKLDPEDVRIKDFYDVCKFMIIRKTSILICLIGFIIYALSIFNGSLIGLKSVGQFLILQLFIVWVINKKPFLNRDKAKSD